ncbi:MAG TPA: site-specific DNA-methyltransferase, partial [Azonexus sp.]|nr:site-specific DNA-methyltransferase [Azonexus sp.]
VSTADGRAGVRIETIGNATLYLGDWREILPTLPKVDLVLTDPPYGIAYVHGGGGKGTTPYLIANKEKTKASGHCKPIHGDDKPFDPALLFEIGDLVFAFGADHYRQRLPEGGTFIAWDKSLGLGPADSFADAEFAWCSWRTKRNVARFMWKGVCGVKAGEDKERSHPTQKPICLMKWCLESAPDSVSTVADPFMGSGTTGVACANLGKTFYGIEREPKYFDIACQRIENAYRQERLFA